MYGQIGSELFSEGGLVSYFVAKGAFKFYFVKHLNFEFISEGGALKVILLGDLNRIYF